MQVKAKTRVYGKKTRQQDNLEDAFACLSFEIDSPKNLRTKNSLSRVPLQLVSSNPGQRNASDSKELESFERKGEEPHKPPTRFGPHERRPRHGFRDEIAALTSLEHVKDDIHDFGQACYLWADNYLITKIAHGSFAAIFRLQLRLDKSKYIIAKLMPIKPKAGRGSRAADQTSIDDAATEVKALDIMSEVPGFVGFSEAWVLRGALPAIFLEQYEIWARKHPDDGFTGYSKEQLWCFIEMSDAGMDLERFLRKAVTIDSNYNESIHAKSLTATQCWDIFWGITEALGRGEEFLEFEHRDLHPGNVCIIQNDASACSTSGPSLRKKYTNLEVTLIDYSLSRAVLSSGDVLANPMKDKSLFEQRIENPRTQQELNDKQQYETYRKMRQLIIERSGSKDECQAWQAFVPQTNVLWLHHILSLLIRSMEKYSKASATRMIPEANQKGGGMTQLNHIMTATEGSAITEEAEIAQLLEMLKESLDPDQGIGCVWSSAKALLESELHRFDETPVTIHENDC